MNNNPNKKRDIVVLAGLIVVLVVVAIFYFSNSSKQQPAPPPATKKIKEKKESTGKGSGKAVDWIDSNRVAGMVGEVKGGRNPFENLLSPVSTPESAKSVTQKTVTQVIPPNGEGQGFAMPVEYVKTTRLEWVSLQQLKQKLSEQVPDVDVVAGKGTGWVKIKGFDEAAVNEAYGLVPTIDKRPPPPPFQLVGIIAGDDTRYAVIIAEGKSYSLYEGETLNGWTITRITPTGVTLRRSKQIESLRLAGGKA